MRGLGLRLSDDRRDGGFLIVGRDDNQKVGALGADASIAAVQRPTMSVVIVAHDSVSDLKHSLPALIGELAEEDELLVVDSGSTDGLDAILGDVAPRARLIDAGANVGFASGVNLGAEHATCELLVVLNPDAVVLPGWGDAMRAPWGGRWTAWMALVTMDGGDVINTSGGVVHYSGIAWAGQAGQPIAKSPTRPSPVAFVSGACLAIPACTWRRIGGFADSYFMYCEDVDLSLRLRLQSGELGIIPDARVVHRYDFYKGQGKWRMLERNRWATLIRCYPGVLLVAVAPALVGVELATWVVALRGRWVMMKALATLDVLLALPRLLRERREIQSSTTIGASAFAGALTAHLESPHLGGRARPISEALSRFYWSWVLRALRRTGRVA